MHRLLFEKVGSGVYISHLDLMRLFQRAFKRGGLNLKHTQGFSPRALVSIALPLSLGTESLCEILDYELDGQNFSHEEIVQRLNATMPSGIQVLESYESNYKIKNLAKLRCRIVLEYDNGIPADAVEEISRLFGQDSLTVEKKGKNGTVQQDIIPMMSDIQISAVSGQELEILVTVCAQNPTLNPQQIVTAIEINLPQCKPDFSRICRLETLFPDGTVFR